jgi:uncharacterized RDD family membrane protein YckC
LGIPDASIGRRIGALLFDGVVYVSFFQGFLWLLSSAAEGVPSELQGLMVLPIFATWWLYVSAAEGFLGKTVGKHLFGLEVRRLNGESLGLNLAAKRRLCDLVDFLLSCGLVALVLALRRRHGQRLGDIVAGTRVVCPFP